MNMYDYILDLPNQLKSAAKIAAELELPGDYESVKNVLVLGMGASAIGGDIAKSLLENTLKVPMQIIRDYSLLDYVDSNSLVIANSYSGNTDEPLIAFQKAKEKRAKLIAITKGGKLAEIANADAIPLLQFEYKAQPRAALGYLFAPIVIILEKLGLSKSSTDFDHVEIADSSDKAKDLAQKIQGKIPVICAGEFLAPVARRAKNQFNENSKSTAIFEEIPEMFHNTIEG